MVKHNTKIREVTQFNISKYQALAYQVQPYGPKFINMIEQNWNQWIETVENSKWLKIWTNIEQMTITPKGNTVVSVESKKAQKVAQKIFTLAVWGFGISDWPHSKQASNVLAQYYNYSFPIRSQIMVNNQNYTIHIEFYELDQWLEPLWQQALITKR